jgi:diguanylate cyclase (GGDEF)-like protein
MTSGVVQGGTYGGAQGALGTRALAFVRALPRSFSYPILGALMVLGVLMVLPLGEALMADAPLSLRWLLSDVARLPVACAYIALSTLLVVTVLGHVVGGWLDRAQLLADTDALTGLFNRRHFARRLAEEMSRASRFRSQTCVLCLDVDRLKAINDRFGHKAGDRALVMVAQAVSRNLRPADVFARLGGDEFAVLLPVTAEKEALSVAGRLLASVSRRRLPRIGHVAVSIGICELGPAASAEEVLAAADAALYRAKREGGGRARAHTEPTGSSVLATSLASPFEVP